MRLRPAAPNNSPKVVCSSNAFLFMKFRTLSHNGPLATPFPSSTSALFPLQRRGRERGFLNVRVLLHFAPCYLVCFHTNPNCPICNPFVLITIRIAGGGWGPPRRGVKAMLELTSSALRATATFRSNQEVQSFFTQKEDAACAPLAA